MFHQQWSTVTCTEVSVAMNEDNNPGAKAEASRSEEPSSICPKTPSLKAAVRTHLQGSVTEHGLCSRSPHASHKAKVLS